MNSLPKAQSLTALRYAFIIAGTALQASGYLSHVDVGATVDAIMQIISGAMIAVPVLWGLYTNFRDRQKAKQNITVAVQAGMQHGAVNGAPASQISPSAAQTIIKTYTPIPGKL